MKDRSEIELKKDGQTFRIQIIRSARKSIGLQVEENGRIILRIPGYLSDQALNEFLKQEQNWMLQKITQMQKRIEQRENTGATAPENLSGEEIEKIKQKIGNRVIHYSRIMNVTFGKITIRNQKTRWGSCSSRGNLNFNYQLYYLPDELLDYVVIHELAHRRHMDHSKEFWAEVEKYCPDYKERKSRLKNYSLV